MGLCDLEACRYSCDHFWNLKVLKGLYGPDQASQDSETEVLNLKGSNPISPPPPKPHTLTHKSATNHVIGNNFATLQFTFTVLKLISYSKKVFTSKLIDNTSV